MTTNISPADPARHLRSAEDPAELLAEARLSLHELPSDCLLLAGTGGRGTPPMLTRSSLRDLLAGNGAAHLASHLALMALRGSGGVHALVVIGDGYQGVLDEVIHEVLPRAAHLLRSAGTGPDATGARLLSVRGAADGRRWELTPVDPSAPRGAQRALPAGTLREFAETRAAASAVLRGRAIPRPAQADPRLAAIGRRLALPPVDLASPADPMALLESAETALAALRDGAEDAFAAEDMTKCEQLAALLSALAVDRLHWELLARLVEHGRERTIEREELLQELCRDPSWRPSQDVCAGGRWYRLLEEVREVATGALDAAVGSGRGTARPAWRALTTLLVLLSWWNHRFATAGRLVDELREREPESTLAPLLSRMTDTPIFPAWWPAA